MEKIKTEGTDLHSPLKKLFGYDSFRENQKEIIEAILRGKDVFVVMPTGGGKSLCYQLPSHLLPGCCIVISPLISLMKDQVDGARENGLRAAFLNSSQTTSERRDVTNDLNIGNLDLLYLAPERISLDMFLANLQKTTISFFAIDEAHCISDWGHEFRPDYLFLSKLKEHFPKVAITAFTATATEKVQKDTICKLGLYKPFQVRASFNRPNLDYQIFPKNILNQQINSFFKQHPGEPTIIYRTTRKNVEATTKFLTDNGIKALPYHAGLRDIERTKNQESFNRDDIDVIVATIAFGMGIDKSNVRFIIHGDLPKTLENYYQETGRAGRDGLPATCILYFSRADIVKLKFFINQISDLEQQRIASDKLNAMVSFASVSICRRQQLLAYFGEKHKEDNCKTCDICSSSEEKVDATEDARILIRTVTKSGQIFGAAHVVDIICGSNNKKIRQYNHNAIITYGKGKDKSKNYWRQLIDELISCRLLVREDGQFPTLSVGSLANELVNGSQKISIRPITSVLDRPAHAPSRAEIVEHNRDLFEKLRVLRKSIADEQNVPPFVVFPDRTLIEMAKSLPSTEEEMQSLYGMGEVKLKKYGVQFMDLIHNYCHTKGQVPQPETSPHNEKNTYSVEEIRKANPNAYSPWTEEDDVLLEQKSNEHLTISQLATNFGRNEGAIKSRLRKIGLKDRPSVLIDSTGQTEKRAVSTGREVQQEIVDLPLRPLRSWRDQMAEQMDVPYYHIFSDLILRKIAIFPPRSADELREFKQIDGTFLESHMNEMIAVLKSSSSEVSYAIIDFIRAFPKELSKTGVAKVLTGDKSQKTEEYRTHHLFGRLRSHNRNDIVLQIEILLKQQVISVNKKAYLKSAD